MAGVWSVTLVIILVCLNSRVKGDEIVASEGENKVIQWTINPAPGNNSVSVFHPSGEKLFIAKDDPGSYNHIRKGTGYNAGRVTNTGNTNTITGHIEFTLNDVRVTDAGNYTASYYGTTVPGVTLVVKRRIIFATEKENKVIQWTIKPAPIGVYVSVLHPSGDVLYTAISDTITPGHITPGYGSNAYRVINPGNTDIFKGHIEFTLRDVSASDAGHYNTSYSLYTWGQEHVEPGVTLVVNETSSKPVITVVSAPVVGQYMVLQCSTPNSEHGGHGVDLMYEWYLNGSQLFLEGRDRPAGEKLYVYNIQKSDKYSTYTCHTYTDPSTQPHISDGYTPNVLYGPKQVSFYPITTTYTLVETTQNTLSPITCSADCNPGCTYKWSRDGTVISTLAVLQLSRATRHDDGTYACNARNYVGNKDSASIRVTVNYRPDNTSIKTNIHNGGVKENDTLSIACTTDSVPAALMSIMFEDDRQRTLYQNRSFPFKFTKSAECLDTGKYFCLATNKYGNSTSRNISIGVLCSPRPSIGFKSDNRVSIDDKGSLNISGSVVAYPRPDITWTLRNNATNNAIPIRNRTDGIGIFMSSNHVTYSSRVVMDNIGVIDFGDYVMNASNVYGSVLLTYHVLSSHKVHIDAFQDQSTFKAGIAMIVLGVLCLGVSLLLTLCNFRRKRSNEQEPTRFRNKNAGSLERENDAYSELDLPRTNTYEDLGEKDKPSVYDKLKMKRQADKTEYVNSK